MCEMAYMDDYDIYNDYNGSYTTAKDQCMCAYLDDVISATIDAAEGNRRRIARTSGELRTVTGTGAGRMQRKIMKIQREINREYEAEFFPDAFDCTVGDFIRQRERLRLPCCNLNGALSAKAAENGQKTNSDKRIWER